MNEPKKKKKKKKKKKNVLFCDRFRFDRQQPISPPTRAGSVQVINIPVGAAATRARLRRLAARVPTMAKAAPEKDGFLMISRCRRTGVAAAPPVLEGGYATFSQATRFPARTPARAMNEFDPEA